MVETRAFELLTILLTGGFQLVMGVAHSIHSSLDALSWKVPWNLGWFWETSIWGNSQFLLQGWLESWFPLVYRRGSMSTELIAVVVTMIVVQAGNHHHIRDREISATVYPGRPSWILLEALAGDVKSHELDIDSMYLSMFLSVLFPVQTTNCCVCCIVSLGFCSLDLRYIQHLDAINDKKPASLSFQQGPTLSNLLEIFLWISYGSWK